MQMNKKSVCNIQLSSWAMISIVFCLMNIYEFYNDIKKLFKMADTCMYI